MKFNINKTMCTALCAAIISLSCTSSLKAQASDIDHLEMFQTEEVQNSLTNTLDTLQTHTQQVKDSQTKRFLTSIHAAASKVNNSPNKSYSKQDGKNALSILDEGIDKFSSSPNVATNTQSARILSNLKRHVAKAHAQAAAKKSARKHHSHDDSHNKTECSKPIPIDRVPVTITLPGKYCVTRDLVYTGSGDAITIVANNVTINFENHNLTLTNPEATGIYASEVSELTILNDKISLVNLPPSFYSRAILLLDVKKALIDNVFTENTAQGIVIGGSSDITISNSHHKNHVGQQFGIAVNVARSNAVHLDNITVEGNSGPGTPIETDGVVFGDCSGCSLKNSKILESDLGVVVGNMDGLLIDNCFVSSSPDTGLSALQLGIFPNDQKAHNVIIRNSTILNEYGGFTVDGMFLLNGSGCIIENVIVDTITPGQIGYYLPAGIHIGSAAGTTFDDVAIRNTIVQTSSSSSTGNQNSFCIFCERTSNTLIENCEVSGAQYSNIVIGFYEDSPATQCAIKNCTSSNAGIAGIEIASSAVGNAIIDNVLSNNKGYGIYVAENALYNHLEGNNIFANLDYGIYNGESSTEFYGNTSCNNVGTNCSSVFAPMFQQQSPGAFPVVVGSNICCLQE